MRGDSWKDMTKLIVASRIFAKAPKKCNNFLPKSILIFTKKNCIYYTNVIRVTIKV
jgi:hypothetical protein